MQAGKWLAFFWLEGRRELKQLNRKLKTGETSDALMATKNDR